MYIPHPSGIEPRFAHHVIFMHSQVLEKRSKHGSRGRIFVWERNIKSTQFMYRKEPHSTQLRARTMIDYFFSRRFPDEIGETGQAQRAKGAD
jgi:hypothetical protein